MNQNYDDDDVVEDYDEVEEDTSSAPAGRVGPEGGGPVRRPSRPVRATDQVLPPDDYDNGEFDPHKGKITQNSAKLIWIVCIVVTVLGIAAVVVDAVWDPLDRRPPALKPDKADRGRPRVNRRRIPPAKTLTPHEKRAKTFIRMVAGSKAAMTNSRAWDLFMTAYWQFDYNSWHYHHLKRKGVTGDELKTAATAAIEAYLDGRYAAELFLAYHYANRVDGFPLVDTDEWEMVLELDDEILDSKEAQEWQAADNKVGSRVTMMKKFRTDVVKNDLYVSNIWMSDELAERHRDFTSKLQGLDQFPDGVDEDDLKFLGGPDYKSTEKMKWEILKEELDKLRRQ